MPRLCLLVLALATGCGGATPSPATTDDAPATGGTLRVGIVVPEDADVDWQQALLDPQAFSWHPLFRCCLLRSLLSYNGQPTVDGGAEPRPDLAVELPEVSPDGRTWTFRLHGGLRYAPPFEDRAILTRDFITALERTVRRGEYPYFEQVQGVEAYRAGRAGTIAGVEAPDDTTLVVRLTEPLGDFGHRAALASLAPIPVEALTHHDDTYPGYLVASGPYMLEGSESVEHDDPDALPVWDGEALGRLTLVRNPSWTRQIDPLRPALVDQIDVVPVASELDGLRAVAAGELDLVLDFLTAAGRDEALATPELRDRLHDAPLGGSTFVALNLAQPPFDDPAVRRAVNLVVDRAGIREDLDPVRGSAFAPIGHALPDLVVGGLLRDYAPFATPGDHGDPRLGREAMTGSGYDRDGDGRCDGDACTVLGNVFRVGEAGRDALVRSLAEIGIQVTFVDEPFMGDPEAHIGLIVTFGWGVVYPSASEFASTLRDPEGPESFDWSLIGATPDQLASWGYAVDAVPSLDDKIDSCFTRSGSAWFACWAELDQLLSEQVMAWVPIATRIATWAVSERVEQFVIADADAGPALERISLRAEGR